MEVNMTKIMLVEDDKSLREIYGVRLLAEGYEIISAGDGEEALAMAVKEKPDLILSDVMMPKISGFDMLDILRSTPETKEIKVIMMTALSSEDQRARGEKLGANRYLVKSQVGIEDVVRTVHDVLADVPAATTPIGQRFGVPVQTAATTNQPTTIPIPTNSIDQQSVNSANPDTQMNTPTATEPTSEVPTTATPSPLISTLDQIATTEPVIPTAPEPTPIAPTPHVINEPMPNTVTADTKKVEATTLESVVLPEPKPSIPVDMPPQLPQPTAPFSTSAPSSLGERIINQTKAANPATEPTVPSVPPPTVDNLIDQQIHDGSETNPVI